MKFKLNLCLAFLLAAPCAFGQVMSGSTPNPDYSGLQLWLKADAGIAAASGSAVMVWTNQSASPFAGANATSQRKGEPKRIGAKAVWATTQAKSPVSANPPHM